MSSKMLFAFAVEPNISAAKLLLDADVAPKMLAAPPLLPASALANMLVTVGAAEVLPRVVLSDPMLGGCAILIEPAMVDAISFPSVVAPFNILAGGA